MKRRAYLAAVAAGVSGTLAGCGTATSLSEEEYDVGMSFTRFLPGRAEVTAGETVVWGNTSSRPHTVTAYGGRIPEEATYFASGGFGSQQAAFDGWRDGEGAVQPGEIYEHTFETPGTYHYFCIPHEPAGMVGTVVVRDR